MFVKLDFTEFCWTFFVIDIVILCFQNRLRQLKAERFEDIFQFLQKVFPIWCKITRQEPDYLPR